MDPDFSSLEESGGEPEEKAFHPSRSATDLVRRRQHRSRRGWEKARKNFLRYATYVACIGLIAGISQTLVGLFFGLAVAEAAMFVVRDVSAAAVGAFVGMGLVSIAIISPIIPLGTHMYHRVEPNIGDMDQWGRESNALLIAGLVCAAIGSAFSANVFVPDHPEASIMKAVGVAASFVGLVFVAIVAVGRVVRRRMH